MMLFNDKYKIELNVSQEVFIDGFIQKTEICEDLINDLFPNKRKDFLGRIDYNTFSIVLNKSSFLHNTCKITGHIVERGNKIQMNGSIKGYKFTLLFILTFALFSVGGMIVNLFFIPGHDDLKIFFSIMTLVSISNSYGAINGLKKYKKQFIEKIKSIH